MNILLKLFSGIACLMFIGCDRAATDMDTPVVVPPPVPVSYLALGDSYTIGESVSTNERWPHQLGDSLVKNGIALSTPLYIATTGWTTSDLKMAILAEALPDTFGLVSLLIGVNNQYRGQDINNYEREFKELLEMAIAKAKGRKDKVFILSIPDYSVTPFGQAGDEIKIRKEIDDYNAINQRVASEMGVAWFDITEISRRAATDLTLLAPDRLHPSGKMYALWVDKIELTVSGIALK